MQRGTVAGACQFRFLLSEKLEPTFHDKMSTCGLGTIPWLNNSLCKSSHSMGLERWGLKLCIAGKSKERFTSELPVLAWSFKTWTERRPIMSVVFFYLYSRVAENIKEIKNIINCKKLPDVWMLRVEGEFRQQEGSVPPTLVNNLQHDFLMHSRFFNAFVDWKQSWGLKYLCNMFAYSRTVADEMTQKMERRCGNCVNAGLVHEREWTFQRWFLNKTIFHNCISENYLNRWAWFTWMLVTSLKMLILVSAVMTSKHNKQMVQYKAS